MRRPALNPAGLPRRPRAKVALDFPEAVAPDQHDHQDVFGDRRLVAEGVAHRNPGRQGDEFDQLDAGGDRLDQLHTGRRRVFGAPDICDQDVGRRCDLGRSPQLLRIAEDFDTQTRRQAVPDAASGVGRDVAEKQRFHLTVWTARKSSRTVMPRPGLSGISISPSRTGKDSSTRSCSNGLAPSEYSTMKPAGDAAATCSPAAKAGAPAQRCGASLRLWALARAEIRIASVMPPQIARSGWKMSTAASIARSRKSCRVNSLSPAAIGMSVAARTCAHPALSSAVTGSSNQARLQSSTRRQKRLASATEKVPCASHINPQSGPSAARAAATRRAEWRGSPSMTPTRILTARNPPASTYPKSCSPILSGPAHPPEA